MTDVLDVPELRRNEDGSANWKAQYDELRLGWVAASGVVRARMRSDRELIEAIVRWRAEARARKDHAFADKCRSVLREAGVVLEDRPAGVTHWRIYCTSVSGDVG